MNIFKSNRNSELVPLVIGMAGLLAQVLGLIACIMGEVTTGDNPSERFYVTIVEHTWTILPAFSIIGLVFAVRCIRTKRSTFGFVALVLNLLWLASGIVLWWRIADIIARRSAG